MHVTFFINLFNKGRIKNIHKKPEASTQHLETLQWVNSRAYIANVKNRLRGFVMDISQSLNKNYFVAR
jgi:hypothetical protein